MKEIPKELQNTLEKCFNDFHATTEEPKSVIRDSTGQFIGVGKLKNPHQSSWQQRRCCDDSDCFF